MAKKHRYRPEEIIVKLKEADTLINQGTSVVETSKHLGVSSVTYYRWRKEYGGMTATKMKRLKDLERENQRLRKIITDLTLHKLILQEVVNGNY